MKPGRTENEDSSERSRIRFPWPDRRTATVLVLLVVATALALRLTGAGSMLPHRVMGDERIYTGQMSLMRSDVADPEHDVRYGFYPHLVTRLALLMSSAPPADEARTLDEHLARASAEVLLLRRLGACISVLGVLATYRLTRLFARRPASLFAAALVATSLIIEWYAPQARPHGAALGLLPLAVLACVHVARRPRPLGYALAGVSIGLAVGALQSGFVALAPLFVAHLLRQRARESRPHVSLLGALAVVAACVRLFYPFAFVDVSDPRTAAALPGHHLFGQASRGIQFFDGSGFRVLIETLWSVDPLIFVLVTGACPAWIVLRIMERRSVRSVPPATARDWTSRLRAQSDLAVVLAFVVPYSLAFGFYALTFPRYVLPLLPFLACFTASTFEGLGAVVSTRAGARRALVMAALAMLGIQTAAACRLTWLRTRPDTLTETARWLEAHVDPSSERTLIMASLDVPLLRDDLSMPAYSTVDPAYPWRLYQMRLSTEARQPGFGLDDLTSRHVRRAKETGEALLPALPAEHLVSDAFEGARLPRLARLVSEIVQELEVRISPMTVDEGDDRPFGFRDQNDEWPAERSWAWRMLRARCIGPVVEIHRLK